MKKHKRIIRTFVSLMVALLAFSGLTIKAEEQRTVRISTIGIGLPYSFLDKNDGEWTGLDAEIWQEIAKRANWKIETLKSTFDGALGNLESGRADVATNHFAATPERMEKYNYSIPYSTDVGCIIVKEDRKELNSLADFKGLKLGVHTGQSSEKLVRDNQEKYGYEVVGYEEVDPAFKDVDMGRIDGLVGSETLVKTYMEQTGIKFRIGDDRLDAQNMVMFFSKTEEGAAFRDEVNKYIQELLDDGTMAKLTEKYFGNDMTQYIIEIK